MSSASSNSGGGNKTMGPPPNQQPRQLPSGANGHRKSSSLNRGWFEGTMEVISGMAPRPVTPSQNQHTRSASAPNSPARGLGMGLFGGGGRNSPHHHFPPSIDRTGSGGSAGGFALPSLHINRLPSQDSLDRSIHNESGHGKSTAQIVRDLKHHNSTLSAKMASLEKRHMNELAQVESASSSKRQELEQISAKQKMKLMQYEQYKAAAESKMKQQDAELSKVKEESAFQRHSISDLKNQLFQLQEELDERDKEVENDDDSLRRPHSDDGHNLPLHPGHSRSNSGGNLVIAPTSSSMSTDDLQQMALDNEELVKEVQELQDQLMEYQGYDKKLKDLQRQLEVAQKSSDVGMPSRPITTTHPIVKNQPERERPPLAPSKSRDQDDTASVTSVSSVSSSDGYRKQLQDAKEELEAQSLKLYQYESSARDLEKEKDSLAEAHSRRVQELEDRFAVLDTESRAQEVALRKELATISQQQNEERLQKEQQGQVIELEEQLEQYAEKLAEVAATLAESRQQAKNQEQYRKDEAEDLRMIQDAHEAEIVRLEKELDEVTKELELRDDELEEVKQTSRRQEKEDEKKLDETGTKGLNGPKDDSKTKLVSNLELQLYKSVETVKKLEIKLEALQKEHSEALTKLEAKNTELSNDLTTAREKEVDSDGIKPNSPGIHQYWEEKTSKTKEVESLKEEIEIMRQRVYESTEAEKSAEQKVEDLETQLQEVRSKETDSNTAKIRAVKSDEQITEFKKTIEELNVLSIENESVKRELQEAQGTLVALDDDKQAMDDQLNELVSSLKKEKEIQNQMRSQLESQEVELVELHDIKSRLKPLEVEKLRLEDEVEELKKHGASKNSKDVSFLTVTTEIEGFRRNLEQEVEDLKDDNSLMKTKLKDRDTTIATLLRSSIVLENKIESLEAEIDESRAKYHETVDEFQEFRSSQVSRDEDFSKTGEEIMYLKGELKVAKADAKRWKRALKEDGTSSGEYRYQISMLQKANEDFADTVQERDQAIQNLINQSIGQEAHVRDLKIRISSLMKEVELVRMKKGRNDEGELRAEIERLQEESEIFAGQIIEQDEEFKRMQRVLIQREENIALMKAEIESFDQRTNLSDKATLQDQDRQISELRTQIDSLESHKSDLVHPKEIIDLRAELDEMLEAAESNRVEIRDLRQQLWEAKDAAGSAGDLRVQLDQVRFEFEEYKRNDTSEMLSDHGNESLVAKLKDLEIELKCSETVIVELREQLSKVSSDGEDPNNSEKVKEETSELMNKNKDLETKLQSKLVELEILTQQLDTSQSEMDRLQKHSIGLQDNLKANKIQLKEASDLKAKLGFELSDSQARLGALEKELMDAITETSSNEELSRKNQSLAQENASLAQKNKSLVQENGSLVNMNDNLVEESETLTNDNQVLCEELKSLSEEKTKEALAEYDALQHKVEDLARVNEALASENKELLISIENLKEKNADTELEQLKIELYESKLQKESFEKTIIQQYEKQYQSLSSSKEAEMDTLRNNLIESREKNSEDIKDIVAELKSKEEENGSLREQFELEMQAKNQQIFALEHTLHAQEQIVDTMRSEMDQIQSGMEHATRARRNEVEEMQQEVMQVEGKTMKQEREIVALKMQLEERKLEHKADVVKLKDALSKAIEQDMPLKQTISDLQSNDRMLEVRERLEQLKAKNTDLQEENLNLGGRLERAAIQIKAFAVEKQQAEETEEENTSLRNQLKEYEQLLSRNSKFSRKVPLPRASNTSPSVSDETAKGKDKKKKKFGLFKRRSVDESISEAKEEEEC